MVRRKGKLDLVNQKSFTLNHYYEKKGKIIDSSCVLKEVNSRIRIKACK